MFNRSSLLDLINRTRDDLLSRLPNDDPLRRSDAIVYARVLAGAANELYGYLEWLSSQIIYDTADADMLRRWAAIWGIYPKAASAASGTVDLTGNADAPIPAGAILQAYDGQQYSVDVAAAIAGSSATVALTAVVPGLAGNRQAGQTLTFVSTPPGVSATGIGGLISGGADAETDDFLRTRFMARIRQQPHGGAAFDYVAWALEVAGFTRAWCFPLEMGAGTVTVRGMCDDSYPDGIPEAGDIAALQSHIEGLRPVTANVICVAPIPDALNFTISGLLPGTTAVQAAVETSLRELIRAESAPGGTLRLSHLQGAIRDAAGVEDFTLVSPSANVVSSTGHISVFNSITWA